MCVINIICPWASRRHRFARAELSTIDQMSGIEFEQYIKFLLEKFDYQKIKETPKAGDQGIDLLAVKNDVKLGFQCKRWKRKVGNKAVQEVHAGVGFYDLNQGIVVTNSYFTESAKQLAKKLHVELWDREHLTKLLKEIKKAELKKKK